LGTAAGYSEYAVIAAVRASSAYLKVAGHQKATPILSSGWNHLEEHRVACVQALHELADAIRHEVPLSPVNENLSKELP
jgi:hypothetical protein